VLEEEITFWANVGLVHLEGFWFQLCGGTEFTEIPNFRVNNFSVRRSEVLKYTGMNSVNANSQRTMALMSLMKYFVSCSTKKLKYRHTILLW
jgi:hypothetical protein